MKNVISTLALGISLFVVSCSSPSPSADDESAWRKFNSQTYQGLNPSPSLGMTALPVLASPAYEGKWGKPKVRVSSSGNYELNYANPARPFDRLVIYGSPKPFPDLLVAPGYGVDEMINGELTGVDHPQSFRTTTINGKPVRWFKDSGSGGADGAYYSTTGFSVTDSSGKTGYYRLVVEGGDDMEAEVARRFSSVTLAP